MLRDPSLIPLSHQHHNGLALCVLTDRTLRTDATPQTRKMLAARIRERFDIELANHFRVEEEILFPAVIRHLGPSELIDRLIAEHRQMEQMVDALQQDPAGPRIEEFLGVLRRHIRCEESDLFESIQKALPREVLDQVGREIDENVIRVCLE